MKRRTGWIAGFAAAALLLTATMTAFGYQSQAEGAVTVAVRGTVTCGAGLTLTATFVDTNGAPVSGQPVVWSFVSSPSASDTITQTPTTTDSKGVATTTLKLGPESGTRSIRATAGTVSATAVLNPSCGAGGVLPNTSTLPAEAAPGQPAPLLLMLFAFVFAVGSGLTLRRLASTRR
jgi:Bacterial Ig-like domain (group 1)